MEPSVTVIKISDYRAFFVVLDKECYKPRILSLNERIGTYARKNKSSVIINGGLFNVRGRTPRGQFVIDGVDLTTDSPISSDKGKPIGDEECYPMVIDHDDRFLTTSHDRTSPLNEGGYIASHYKSAICGWGVLYENGVNQDFISKDAIWGNKRVPRQIVGHLKNGDYFILTCENAYYKDIYSFLDDKDIEFAYSLDGGRSIKLFINGKRLNSYPIPIGIRYLLPSGIEFVKTK